MRSPQVSFEFVKRGFDFPSVVIKCRQFCRRRQCVVEDSGCQPIQRICPCDSFQSVFDDPHHNSIAPAPLILLRRIDAAPVRTVGQTLFTGEQYILSDPPQ